MAVKNKVFKIPFVFALMFVLTVIMAALTWILPAGTYDIDPQTKRVIAGSYHEIARNPQGLWDKRHCTERRNDGHDIFHRRRR